MTTNPSNEVEPEPVYILTKQQIKHLKALAYQQGQADMAEIAKEQHANH